MLSVRHPAYRYHPPDIQTRRGRPSKKHHRVAHSLSHKPTFGPNARPPRTDRRQPLHVLPACRVGNGCGRTCVAHTASHTCIPPGRSIYPASTALAPFILPAATIWPRRTLHAQTALTSGVCRGSVQRASSHATTGATALGPIAFLAYTVMEDEPSVDAEDADEVFSCHGS